MKRFAIRQAAGFLALIIAPLAWGAPPRKLVYGGSDGFPPYDYLDEKGRPSGFNVELVRSLAREAGVEVEFRLGNWAEMMAEFDAGRIDLMSMVGAPERRSSYSFLFQTWSVRQVMAFRPGRDSYPTRLDQLAGETVALPARSVMHEKLEALAERQRPKFRLTANVVEAASALRTGVATVAIANELTIMIAAARMGESNLVTAPLASRPYYLVTLQRRRPEFAFLIEHFERLKQNGEYARLAEEHLTVRPPLPSWQRVLRYSGAGALVFLAVLLGVMVWNRSLRRRVDDALAKRRLTAEALRSSEERWQLAMRNDGLWDWDAQADEVYYSPRYKEMLGYQEHELPDQPGEWRRWVHPEDLPGVLQQIRDHLERGAPHYQSEYRIRCKDGSYKWVLARGHAVFDNDGKPLRLVGSHTDITEHKKAEASLRERETLLRTIINTEADCVKLLGPGAELLDINPAGLAMIEAGAAEQVLGRSVIPLIAPEYRRAFAALNRRVFQGESGRLEFEIIGLQGARRWLETSAVPLRDTDGRITSLLSVTRDISDRKRVEQELDAARQAADAANLSKSEFLANMSHEIRTPMNGVLGMAALLLETDLSVEQREYARTVEKSGNALLSIIDEILDFSKVEAGKVLSRMRRSIWRAWSAKSPIRWPYRPTGRASNSRCATRSKCRAAWPATPGASARSC